MEDAIFDPPHSYLAKVKVPTLFFLLGNISILPLVIACWIAVIRKSEGVDYGGEGKFPRYSRSEILLSGMST